MPVNVSIEQADGHTERHQRDRQVDRDRRLADAALAAGDRVDLGQRARLGERDLLRGLAAAQFGLELAPLFLAHHVQIHAYGGDTRQLADRGRYLPGDRVTQRAAGHGQENAHQHHSARRDLDALHHAQIGDRPVDLGIVHGGQRLSDLLGGGQDDARGRWR